MSKIDRAGDRYGDLWPMRLISGAFGFVWGLGKFIGWAGGILFLVLLIWLLSLFGIPDFGDLITISKRLTQIEGQADGNTASVAALQDQVNGRARQIEELLSQQGSTAAEIQGLNAELGALQELNARQAERITALESERAQQPESPSAEPIEIPQPVPGSVPEPAAGTEAAPGEGWLAYLPAIVRENPYWTGGGILALAGLVFLLFRGGSEGSSTGSGSRHSARWSSGASYASAHLRSATDSGSSQPRRGLRSG